MQVGNLYTLEIDAESDPVLHQTIELLKQAIIDWPTEIKTVEEFLSILEKYLHCSEITIDVVNKTVSNVSSTREFWQLEALSSIQEMIMINKEESLQTIIKGMILCLR